MDATHQHIYSMTSTTPTTETFGATRPQSGEWRWYHHKSQVINTFLILLTWCKYYFVACHRHATCVRLELHANCICTKRLIGIFCLSSNIRVFCLYIEKMLGNYWIWTNAIYLFIFFVFGQTCANHVWMNWELTCGMNGDSRWRNKWLAITKIQCQKRKSLSIAAVCQQILLLAMFGMKWTKQK